MTQTSIVQHLTPIVIIHKNIWSNPYTRITSIVIAAILVIGGFFGMLEAKTIISMGAGIGIEASSTLFAVGIILSLYLIYAKNCSGKVSSSLLRDKMNETMRAFVNHVKGGHRLRSIYWFARATEGRSEEGDGMMTSFNGLDDYLRGSERSWFHNRDLTAVNMEILLIFQTVNLLTWYGRISINERGLQRADLVSNVSNEQFSQSLSTFINRELPAFVYQLEQNEALGPGALAVIVHTVHAP